MLINKYKNVVTGIVYDTLDECLEVLKKYITGVIF